MIPLCSVTGPCGHTSDFDLACIRRDQFACPICGGEWHVVQAPPIVHPSGWIEPGKRTVKPGLPAPAISNARRSPVRTPRRKQQRAPHVSTAGELWHKEGRVSA